jgi:O-methyltransferase
METCNSMIPLDYAKQICYSSEEVLMFSYETAKKYADKRGVYVECGVAAGAQIIAMAHGAPNKTIYAFDSFEGIPLPSNRDDQMPGIKYLSEKEIKALPEPGKQKLESSGATVVIHDHFINHLKDSGVLSNNIISVIGWFEETVKDFNEPISILRLDGDLYNSTYVCLEHLYKLVIKGGIVIIDDWDLPGCRAAVLDFMKNTDQFNKIIPISGNSGPSYFIK